MILERAKRSNRRVSAGLVVAFVTLALVGVVTFTLANSQRESAVWVEHTHAVIESIATLSGQLTDAQNAGRAYLLTGDREELAAGEEARLGIELASRRLQALTLDNASQQARIERLAPAIESLLANIQESSANRSTVLVAAHSGVRRGGATLARIRLIVFELLAEERRLLVLREEALAESFVQKWIIQIAGAVVCLALLLLAFLALRRESRRRILSDVALRASEAATHQLNDELERRVQARTVELQAANRELEAFSYSVAHDLRTPLRGLSGFAEILLEDYTDKLDAAGVDALHEIRDNSLKMGVLIDALLSLARVTRSESRSSVVDLSAFVRTIAGGLQAAEPRIGFELVVQDHVEANLDPHLALMLLQSLVGNAWKFTSKGSVSRIEFGTDTTDGARTFFVRDNGAGFDMAHAAKMFVPFHRLHTSAEFPGTGIGLSTARRIVTRFGGRIWADGQVDRGATVHFTLSEQSSGATS